MSNYLTRADLADIVERVGRDRAYITWYEGLAAELRAHKPAIQEDESASAYGYLSRLLLAIAPQVTPMKGLLNLCTQVDSAIVTLREREDQERRWKDGEYGQRIETLRKLYAAQAALKSIAKNTCCGPCREAALVAQAALAKAQA